VLATEFWVKAYEVPSHKSKVWGRRVHDLDHLNHNIHSFVELISGVEESGIINIPQKKLKKEFPKECSLWLADCKLETSSGFWQFITERFPNVSVIICFFCYSF
jgi:hypothetical protein